MKSMDAHHHDTQQTGRWLTLVAASAMLMFMLCCVRFAFDHFFQNCLEIVHCGENLREDGRTTGRKTRHLLTILVCLCACAQRFEVFGPLPHSAVVATGTGLRSKTRDFDARIGHIVSSTSEEASFMFSVWPSSGQRLYYKFDECAAREPPINCGHADATEPIAKCAATRRSSLRRSEMLQTPFPADPLLLLLIARPRQTH